MAQANVRLTVDATSATRALQGVQNKTNALQKSFGGLRTAIGGIGVTLLAKNAITTAANFDKLNLRLSLLTKNSADFAESQKIAAEAQKTFGLSTLEALEGVTNITARLAPLGSSVEDIKTVFFGFNTAAKLAGASAQESSNAFRQLAQALGSGRLAGDEFRSVSEQVPTVLAPIAEELGVNIGQLKEFAAQGKLQSDVVLRALKRVGNEGSEFLQELLKNDPTQVFKNLSNETENLSRAFGESLMPVVMPVIKGLTELTKQITAFVNSPVGKTSLIFTGIAFAAKAAAVSLVAAKVAFIAAGGGAVILAAALNALPFIALATAIGAVTTAIIKQTKERKKLNDLVKAGGEEEVKAAIKTLEARQAVLEIQKRGGNLRREALENIRNQIEELQKRLGIIKNEKNAIDETTDSTGKLSEAFKKVGDNIATGVSDALHDAVMQTRTLGEAARSILQGIASDLLRLGINTLLKSTTLGIFKNLPTFAAGGRPPVGKPSIVGEKGPELFVPSTAGTIIPNSKMGGMGGTTNIVVNVDASGSNVEGDEEEGRQLGVALSAAIQTELIKQKRAGGLLA